MKCPKCGRQDVHVIDSRETNEIRRRRYVCDRCGFRWTTREISNETYQRMLASEKTLFQVRKTCETCGVKQNIPQELDFL